MSKATDESKRLLEERIAALEKETQAEASQPWMKELQQFKKEVLATAGLKDREKTAIKHYTALKQENGALKRQVLDLSTQVQQAQTENAMLEHKVAQLNGLSRRLAEQRTAIEKQAKAIAEEEHAKRVELTAKFQASLSEITSKVEASNQEQQQRDEQYQAMQGKIDDFVKQSELREEQVAKVLKTKDLEKQLAEAKLQQEVENNRVLKKQLEDQAKAIEEYKKSSTSVFDEFKKLSAQAKKQQKELAQHRKAAQRMKKLEKEMGEWRNAFDRLNKQCGAFKDAHAEQRKLTTLLKEQMEGVKAERDASQTEVARLKKLTTALSGSCKEMQEQRSALEAELAQLRGEAAAAGKSEEEEGKSEEAQTGKGEEEEKKEEEQPEPSANDDAAGRQTGEDVTAE